MPIMNNNFTNEDRDTLKKIEESVHTIHARYDELASLANPHKDILENLLISIDSRLDKCGNSINNFTNGLDRVFNSRYTDFPVTIIKLLVAIFIFIAIIFASITMLFIAEHRF